MKLFRRPSRRSVMRTGIGTLGATVALAAAGCMPTEPAPEPVQVTAIAFWHFWDAGAWQTVEPFLAEFHRRTPEVRVTPVFQAGGGGGMSEKLIAAVASGTPPDIATMFPRYLARLIEGNVLAPWDIPAADKKDIYEAIQRVFAYKGQTWAIPIEHSVYGLYWNRTLFREAGLTGPPKTLQELAEFGRRIARDDDGAGRLDRWGFRDDGSTTIFNWYFSNEVRFVSEDGRRILFDAPPLVEVLEYWSDLARRHRATEFPMPSRDLWHLDRVGMQLAGSWRVQENVQRGRDFDTATIPKWKVDATEAAPDCLAILNSSQARVAAGQKLANWLAGKEVFTTLAVQHHYLPIRKSILEGPEYQQYLRQYPQARGLIEMVPHQRAKPLHPVWQEIEGQLAAMRDRVERGEASPRAAVATAARTAQGLVDQYYAGR